MSSDDWHTVVALIEGGDAAALDRALAERKALARAKGHAGESAVLTALYRGRRDLAELLARAKEGIDLFEMVGLGALAGIEGLFEITGDAAPVVGAVSPDGFTVLQLSCYLAQPRVTALLLEHGAPVDAVATNGSELRAIHAAVAGGDRECLALVLAADPQVDAPQRGGFTALQAAAHRGHVALVELLLLAGADPDRPAEDGRTARDQAAEHPAVLALFD